MPQLTGTPDVLQELLHSLSQPLTSLRCSLELSFDEGAETQRKSVSAALRQTEDVIGMIRLMREYLDAERVGENACGTSLAVATRSVVEELSSIAMVRGVKLRLIGTCVATVLVPESRLRLALQYLVASMIESQTLGGPVTLLLGEGPAGAVLRAECEGVWVLPASASLSTLRRVRLAIATRVLESAGASLVFGDGGKGETRPAGFVLRVPRRVSLPA
jgi:signal transduction histidine kinase